MPLSMGIATQPKGSFRPWSDFYDTGTAALLLNRELLPVSRRACRILFAQNCDAVPKPNRPRPVAIADSGSPPLRCIAHRCCRPRLRTPQAGAVLLAKVSIGGGRKADRVEQPLRLIISRHAQRCLHCRTGADNCESARPAFIQRPLHGRGLRYVAPNTL
jgi:hypothetical protein